MILTYSSSNAAQNIKDAKELILSKSSAVQLLDADNVSLWRLNSMHFNSNEFQWIEVTTSAKIGPSVKDREGLRVQEEYFVNPKELSYPVLIKNKSLVFECLSERCMRVKVAKKGTVGSAYENEINSELYRVKNTWYFNSEDDANRVANAMNFLLKSYGAKERMF